MAFLSLQLCLGTSLHANYLFTVLHFCFPKALFSRNILSTWQTIC